MTPEHIPSPSGTPTGTGGDTVAAGGVRHMTGWLVASDIDHTLMEGPDEAALAGACLRRLHTQGAATLLASSKTFGEMVSLHEEAGLPPQPFLFENGGGIGWPLAAWPAQLAAEPGLRLGAYGGHVCGADPRPTTGLLRELQALLGLRFALLGELSVVEVAQRLGLPEHRAGLALERVASVPLVWHDDDAALARLRLALEPQGLAAERGGRLVHVGAAGGKGAALERVRPWLTAAGLPTTHAMLACGDSESDRGLLEAAAIALVFHRADRPPLALADPPTGHRPRRASVIAGGPRPWLEAVEAALLEAGPTPEPR